MINSIQKLFNNEIGYIAKSNNLFGFRERAKIERCLFITLKFVCNNFLSHEVHGFNKAQIEEIQNKIQNEDQELLAIINQLFEFKIFIKSLSANSAYIVGDTLSRVNITSMEVENFLKVKSESVFRKIRHKLSKKSMGSDSIDSVKMS